MVAVGLGKELEKCLRMLHSLGLVQRLDNSRQLACKDAHA